MLTRFRILFLFSWVILSPSITLAEELCYDPNPVFDQIRYWNFTKPARWDFYLPSENINGPFKTRAATHISWNGQLDVSFDHILPPEQVGLQYTVHRLQIEIGQAGSEEYFVFDQDFTQNCTQPGLSFFPGESHKLEPILIPNLPPPGESKLLPIHVTTWGHL